MTLTARDAMVGLGDCIKGGDSLLEAARRMTSRSANSMAVVDGDGDPLGILAGGDVVRAVAAEVAPEKTTVADVLAGKSGEPVAAATAIEAEASLESVLTSMRESGADILKVTEAGRPIGVVRRGEAEAYSYEPPDGLPLPPPDVMQLVSGIYRTAHGYRSFYDRGVRSAETVRSVLTRNGAGLEDLEAVLDFGCGCGRVMRHWRGIRDVALHGTDYNPALIAWCRTNLPFASFQLNGLEPALDYPDASFDFIYSFSVFTHLDAEIQLPWFAELKRVVRTGGLVMLTLFGKNRLRRLEAQDREAFLAGELVVHRGEEVGTNACTAFHPEGYVREVLGAELELVELNPSGAPEIGQDVAVFRKAG
jgi:SAM-dependent methyltransferase/CBS domain-containing protein